MTASDRWERKILSIQLLNYHAAVKELVDDLKTPMGTRSSPYRTTVC